MKRKRKRKGKVKIIMIIKRFTKVIITKVKLLLYI